MSFGNVVKRIGIVVGGALILGAKNCIERCNDHNEKVKKLKIEYEKKSVEELKAIFKREVEKGNALSAEAVAASAVLKEKGVTNINQ